MSFIKRFLNSSLYNKSILPASILSGTIIGAGIFSLPFIFSEAGWVLGISYLVLFSLVFYLVHVMYADVILRSGREFKFVGYAKHYLGELAFWMSILVTVIGSLLTLAAYLILADRFLTIIFDIPDFLSGFSIFWIMGSLAILINIKRVARIEFVITAGIIAITFFIFIFGLLGNPLKVVALPSAKWALFFLPFGPILFSLSGRTAIPAVIEYYEKNSIPFTNFKKVVFWGTMVPVFMYFMFIVGVIGISRVVTGDSIVGIANLPLFFPLLISMIGLLSLLSSYIIIGLSIDEILNTDLKFPRIFSRLITIIIPPILLYIGFDDFIKIISLAGGIFLALEGVIVVSMWRRMESLEIDQFLFIKRRLPQFFSYALIIIFFIGALYTAIY